MQKHLIPFPELYFPKKQQIHSYPRVWREMRDAVVPVAEAVGATRDGSSIRGEVRHAWHTLN